MNEQEKQNFIDIIEGLKELRLRKSADYGSSWKVYGTKGIEWQIRSKFVRLMNLTRTGQEPKNEPVRDTLLDMANYCIMWIQLIDTGQTEDLIDKLLEGKINIE